MSLRFLVGSGGLSKEWKSEETAETATLYGIQDLGPAGLSKYTHEPRPPYNGLSYAHHTPTPLSPFDSGLVVSSIPPLQAATT